VDLVTEAEAVLQAAEAAGLRAALLGGLAVRAHAGAVTRETFDIDVTLPSTAEVDAFGALLAFRGYAVLEEPWWRRGIREDPEGRIVVDWTGPEIVDPTTLERFVLGPERARKILASSEVAVVSRADLLALKLLAGRDQDVADLAFLVGDPLSDARAVESRAREAGALSRVRSEAQRLRFALHLGEAQEATTRVLGRVPGADRFECLSTFAEALAVEGTP
jgi:hypothetical protein